MSAARSRPVIFSGESVRAILEGRKTQTRRVIGRLGQDPGSASLVAFADGVATFEHSIPDDPVPVKIRCPYGQPGDLLWVRETWADVNSEYGPAIIYRADQCLSPWTDWCIERGPDEGAGPSMNYDRYPGEYTMWWTDLLRGEPEHRWRPSIHMPRWACRLWLRVLDVRVERLQEIHEADAREEGLRASDAAYVCQAGDRGHKNAVRRKDLEMRARGAFACGWDSINAKRGFGWNENPWVWVITFEPLEPSI